MSAEVVLATLLSTLQGQGPAGLPWGPEWVQEPPQAGAASTAGGQQGHGG